MEWRDLSAKRNKEKRTDQTGDSPESGMPLKTEEMPWHIIPWVVGGIVLIWLATGLYIVEPGEVGIIQRFGRITETREQGLHYHLPLPIETVTCPNIKEISRLEIGFRTVDPGPPAKFREVPLEARMLARDENLIDINFTVQYQIRDPRLYLFHIRDQEKAIHDAAESTLCEIVGKNKIDDVLTVKKYQIQQEAQDTLQKILDLYQSGLRVVTVDLQNVHPPADVAEAFKSVVSARDDKNRLISEAHEYSNEELSKARMEATRMINEAEACRDEIVRRAEGDAARFLQNYAQYKGAEEVTRKRLYLETLEQILPKAQKYIVESGREFIGVLPFGKDMAESLGGISSTLRGGTSGSLGGTGEERAIKDADSAKKPSN